MGTTQAKSKPSGKIPKKVKIIPCTSMQFIEKDLIEIQTWEDFVWLLGKHTIIFKLKNTYYIPTQDFVYIHTEK